MQGCPVRPESFRDLQVSFCDGSLDDREWLLNQGVVWNVRYVDSTKPIAVDVLEWWRARGKLDLSTGYVNLSSWNKSMLWWFINNVWQGSYHLKILPHAIKFADLQMIQHLTRDPAICRAEMNDRKVCFSAVKEGVFEMIEWLDAHQCQWTSHALGFAHNKKLRLWLKDRLEAKTKPVQLTSKKRTREKMLAIDCISNDSN